MIKDALPTLIMVWRFTNQKSPTTNKGYGMSHQNEIILLVINFHVWHETIFLSHSKNFHFTFSRIIMNIHSVFSYHPFFLIRNPRGHLYIQPYRSARQSMLYRKPVIDNLSPVISKS